MRLIIDVLTDLIIGVKKNHDKHLHIGTTGWVFQSFYDYYCENNETLHISYNYSGVIILLRFEIKNNLIIEECRIIDFDDKKYIINCDIDLYLNMTDEIKTLLILEDDNSILRKPFPFKEVL